MRKMRFLSLFLSLVFMISAFSGAVISAQDTTDTNTADNAATTSSPFADVTDAADYEAIKLLYDLDIIKGTGVNAQGLMEFTPDRSVSREEMALFIARIRSATPQYFVSDETQKTIFDDITDPTYYTAVNYCVEMDIINGYPDGSFKPKDTVTLQEAAKMMVTALGYTALSYPVGYLSKANEPDVNLLKGFQNSAGTKTLTRIEVARLLYNYFLSNYNYVDVTYNSIDKKYESTMITKPVCEKFGIEKITAYITGVQDLAVNLVVRDTRLTAGEVTLAGQALTAKEATIGNKNDIYVSYYTTVTGTSSGTTVVTPKIESAKMSKTRLGYASDFDATTLLGLKITMYRSIRNSNVTVPTSYVTGTKTTINSIHETTTANTSATVTGDNFDTIKSLTIAGRAFDLNPPADITSKDIYTAGTTATYTNTNSSLLELARFIASKGYYKLQCIDNGRDNQGNEELYYIFTPFQVGYYNGVNNDGKILLTGGAYEKTNADLTKNLSAGGTAVTLTVGEAYLYTIEGNTLNVYKQLHKVASGITPTYIYGNTASFANLTVTFSTSTTQFMAKNALSTATSRIRSGGTYSIYSFASGTTPFFVHETTEPATVSSKDYAVITHATGTTGVIDGKLSYLFTGVTMYSNNKTSLLVSAVNGAPITSTSAATIHAGDAVAYRKNGNTYEVYTEDNAGFALSGQRTAVKETSPNRLVKGTDFTYSASSGLLTTAGATGLVTGNTKFILVSSDLVDARTMTKSEFDSKMTSVNASSEIDAKRIVMVTKSTAASEAPVVIVTAHTTFAAPATAYNLGIVITPNKGTVPSSNYTIATVYSYKLGAEVDVAGDAADLAFGNIVNITENTTTVGTSTIYNIGSITFPSTTPPTTETPTTETPTTETPTTETPTTETPTTETPTTETPTTETPTTETPTTTEPTTEAATTAAAAIMTATTLPDSITADTTFMNVTTDLSKVVAVSDAAHKLQAFTKHTLVTYGSAPTVKTLNTHDVNVITVTLYTNLTTDKANLTGTRSGNTVSNWARGTNVAISMGRVDLATITENPVIFTGTGGAADIHKYYAYVNDVNNNGTADFITIVRYVINNTATTMP